MTRRDRKIRYGAAVGIALIGVACGATISGTLGGTLATGLIGLGMIAFVSLLFYEVGLTEDRDRAREDRARARAREQTARAQRPAASPARPKSPRPLDRMRGRRRRLP